MQQEEQQQKELAELAAGHACAQAAAQAAVVRAEAAELRVAQLEKEADSLARDVATLQASRSHEAAVHG